MIVPATLHGFATAAIFFAALFSAEDRNWMLSAVYGLLFLALFINGLWNFGVFS